jgi:7-keto-8-aminopelargonate synthetase-like enzyme
LLFPSGYQANLSVVTALANKSTLVCCDKRNHASLIDACFLAQARGATVRFYDDLTKLRSVLEKHDEPDGYVADASASALIVSDAVYSMDGDLAPLPQLIEIAREFGAMLVLDDAHGTGTLGGSGRGALEYFFGSDFPMDAKIVQVGTLSKALGAQGGFACGTQALVDWLVNSARPFVYTTGLNPASCGAALASLQVIAREPERVEKLNQNKTALATGLMNLGLNALLQPSPIVPVIVGEADDAVEFSERLLERGVWCPAIRPPTVPQGTSRLRVTASASLSAVDIERVLSAFAVVS